MNLEQSIAFYCSRFEKTPIVISLCSFVSVVVKLGHLGQMILHNTEKRTFPKNSECTFGKMAEHAESPLCCDEHVLKIEAQAAVKEVAFAVKSVEMSKTLPATEELVYLNLRTKEDVPFCVELTVSGFRVC